MKSAGRKEISIVATVIHEQLIGVDTMTRLNISVDPVRSNVPKPSNPAQPLKAKSSAADPKISVQASKGDKGRLSYSPC